MFSCSFSYPQGVDPDAAHASLPWAAQIAATQVEELTSEHAVPIAACVPGVTW